MIETTVVKVKGGAWVCPANLNHNSEDDCSGVCRQNAKISEELQAKTSLERQSIRVLVTRTVFSLNAANLNV